MYQDKIIIAFLHKIGFSQKDLRVLFYENINTPMGIYEKVEKNDFSSFHWIRADRKEKIFKNFSKFSLANIEDAVHKRNIVLITRDEEQYPKKLLEIANSPYILYVRGNLETKNLSFAIVGSRKSTNYGRNFLETLFRDLPTDSVGIIS